MNIKLLQNNFKFLNELITLNNGFNRTIALLFLFLCLGVNEVKGQNNYTLVTDVSQLTVGSKYIISSSGSSGSAFVMSYQNTNNRPQATSAVTISSNMISVAPAIAGLSDLAKPYELILGGTSGNWTLTDVNGIAISSVSGTNNYLKSKSKN